MNQYLPGRIRQAAMLALSVSMLVGCTATFVPLQPTDSPIQATLTALVLPVQVSRPNTGETSLKQDDTVVVGIDDRVGVPESGHAVVQVGDRLVVDVLAGRTSAYRRSDVSQAMPSSRD